MHLSTLSFLFVCLGGLAVSVRGAPGHPHNSPSTCVLNLSHAKICTASNQLSLSGLPKESPSCSGTNTTVIFVDAKSPAHIHDASGKFYRGRFCRITIPGWSLPATNGTSSLINVSIPVSEQMSFGCSNDLKDLTASEESSKRNNDHHHSRHHTTTTKKAHHHTTTKAHHHTTTKAHHHTTTTTKHHHTTTTKKTAKHTSSSSSSSSSSDHGKVYTGEVTFFTPDNNACGSKHEGETYIAALGPSLYGDMDGESKYCGRKIYIENGSKHVTVTVADACPECAASHLDLSPDAFGKLGSYDTGILPVKWWFID